MILLCTVVLCKRPLHPDTPPPLQRGDVQSDSMRDKGIFKSICPELGKEQCVTEQAPLFSDDVVQRVTGIVHNVQ